MKKILFLCHGNICRSPMAEFIFKELTKGQSVYVESMAVSREEIGNDIYPPAKQILRQKGIAFSHHSARQITRQDYEQFDYIIVMEKRNIPRLMSIISQDDLCKIYRLLDFTDAPGDIDDPWYSGNFEKTYNEIYCGCAALLSHLKQNGEI